MTFSGGRAVSAALLATVAAHFGLPRSQAQVAFSSPVRSSIASVVMGQESEIGADARKQILQQAGQQDKMMRGLSPSTRRKVLLAFVLTEYAQAAGIAGFDTNQLTKAQRLDAEKLVDQLVPASPGPAPAPSPSPPRPAPQPPPQPPPQPAPQPAPHPAPWPAPYPAPPPHPYYVVITPPQPLVIPVAPPIYYIPVVAPAPSPSRKHHFFSR